MRILLAFSLLAPLASSRPSRDLVQLTSSVAFEVTATTQVVTATPYSKLNQVLE